MKLNQAATEYAVMRQEANTSHELYMQVQEKVEEAGLAAGIHGSNISVVDPARQPVKPVAPDLPLYMAITFFAGLWLAVGGALLLESIAAIRQAARRLRCWWLLLAVHGGACAGAHAEHLGAAHGRGAAFRIRRRRKACPMPRKRRRCGMARQDEPGRLAGAAGRAGCAAPMPAPIGPGDFLEISEYHTPEFHSAVRVSAAGTVTLPMIGEVQSAGWTSRPRRTPLKRRWWPRECCCIRWFRCW